MDSAGMRGLRGRSGGERDLLLGLVDEDSGRTHQGSGG